MTPRRLHLLVIAALAAAGCGRPPAAAPSPRGIQQATLPAAAERPAATSSQEPQSPPFWNPETAPPADEPPTIDRSMDVTQAASPPLSTEQRIDPARIAAAGIRKIESRRLVLYTDLPASPEIDRLGELFDQAYPVWCRYFGVPADEPSDWRLTGYLMKEKLRFQGAGLLPNNLPAFANGFSRGDEIWLYEQPNDYYRRHLLLHEGTHGFMYTRLRASAPPWYLEGIAELLATHRIVDDRLQMNYFPRTREEVPLWGRIKIVQDDYAAARGQFLSQVFDTPPEAHLRVEAYGWCWAAAAFLDGHPRYRTRFRQAARLSTAPDFGERLRGLYGDGFQELSEEWQVFVANLEYGYDLRRSAIDFRPGEALPVGGASVTIAADRGWQSSGLRLEAGQPYRLCAAGRYQVADQPKIWWSEPGGVSIRYYRGRPLGMLLAAIRYDDADAHEASGLLKTAAVGLETTLTPDRAGTLYLRINDSPAELADNAGALSVEVIAAER